MRQIFPENVSEIDADELLANDRPSTGNRRPWVRANMIASIDGAFAVDGRSRPLGGPADTQFFHALRGASDIVLAGAATVRQERYRRPAASPAAAAHRERAGMAAAPRLVIISRSLDLPDDLPLLTGAGPEPLVVHPRDADPAGRRPGLEFRTFGSGGVDLAAMLASLADDGATSIICEGGPRLLGQLHEADLIDEFFLTVSPNLVGGEQIGLLGPTPPRLAPFELHRVLESDGLLLTTYRRRRD